MLTRLFVPFQTVGANAVHFDLFNASGSGSRLQVIQIVPVVSGASAVSGVVSVDLFLTRTSAVGTGGTAATFGGTTLTACTFSPYDWEGTIMNTNITARLTPTGGATAGAVLSWTSVFTEETSSASYLQYDLVNAGNPKLPPISVKEGTGIRVVQGSVASVGTVGYNVLFDIEPTR